MRWDTVLFDMDGTLTDSQEGIVKSVSYALERLGRELPPRDTLTAFIGPPLHESFSAICGMDEAETERAVCEFRDYFARRGWAETYTPAYSPPVHHSVRIPWDFPPCG